jgi:hypothetical protein
MNWKENGRDKEDSHEDWLTLVLVVGGAPSTGGSAVRPTAGAEQHQMMNSKENGGKV